MCECNGDIFVYANLAFPVNSWWRIRWTPPMAPVRIECICSTCGIVAIFCLYLMGFSAFLTISEKCIHISVRQSPVCLISVCLPEICDAKFVCFGVLWMMPISLRFQALFFLIEPTGFFGNDPLWSRLPAL